MNKIVRIEELCKKITDGSHFSPSDEMLGQYPMFSVKDMTYNGFDDSDCKHINIDVFEKLARSDCRPLKNDILIAKDGSYLKHVFKCEEDLNACILSSIAILRPNLDVVNPDFFVYVLRTLSVKKAMANYVSGSALPRIILSDFKKMKIKINMDKIWQEKVSDILLKYDELIENNNKRIKILEQMAENLYKEWFVRFRFPGHETTEFENGMPKGWQTKRLGEFGVFLDSGSRPKGGIDDTLIEGVPSLGAEAVGELAQFDYSSVKYIPHEFYDKMKRGKFDGNAILVYKDGAYIGKTTIFRNKFPFENFAANEHVFLMKSTNFAYQNYLYFTLHQKEYFYLMQNLNRNAAQPGLAQPDIKRIKITVPTEDVAKRFNVVIEPLFDEIFQIAKTNRNLIKQRDMLLPRLMSGKLEVN